MKYKVSLLNALLLACVLSSNAIAAYPYKCPKEAGGTDKWNFIKCNCTSYVAYKLNEAGIQFNNSYQQPEEKPNTWSSAYLWKDAADRAGISYDKTPRAGDVVYWAPNHGGAGDAGHVAYVESVNADKKMINISEYNWDEHVLTFNKREISIDTPSEYIHFFYPKKFFHIEESNEFNSVKIEWYPADKSCVDAYMRFYNDTCDTRPAEEICKEAQEGLSGFSLKYFSGDWSKIFSGHEEIKKYVDRVGSCNIDKPADKPDVTCFWM